MVRWWDGTFGHTLVCSCTDVWHIIQLMCLPQYRGASRDCAVSFYSLARQHFHLTLSLPRFWHLIYYSAIDVLFNKIGARRKGIWLSLGQLTWKRIPKATMGVILLIVYCQYKTYFCRPPKWSLVKGDIYPTWRSQARSYTKCYPNNW